MNHEPHHLVDKLRLRRCEFRAPLYSRYEWKRLHDDSCTHKRAIHGTYSNMHTGLYTGLSPWRLIEVDREIGSNVVGAEPHDDTIRLPNNEVRRTAAIANRPVPSAAGIVYYEVIPDDPMDFDFSIGVAELRIKREDKSAGPSIVESFDVDAVKETEGHTGEAEVEAEAGVKTEAGTEADYEALAEDEAEYAELYHDIDADNGQDSTNYSDDDFVSSNHSSDSESSEVSNFDDCEAQDSLDLTSEAENELDGSELDTADASDDNSDLEMGLGADESDIDEVEMEERRKYERFVIRAGITNANNYDKFLRPGDDATKALMLDEFHEFVRMEATSSPVASPESAMANDVGSNDAFSWCSQEYQADVLWKVSALCRDRRNPRGLLDHPDARIHRILGIVHANVETRKFLRTQSKSWLRRMDSLCRLQRWLRRDLPGPDLRTMVMHSAAKEYRILYARVYKRSLRFELKKIKHFAWKRGNQKKTAQIASRSAARVAAEAVVDAVAKDMARSRTQSAIPADRKVDSLPEDKVQIPDAGSEAREENDSEFESDSPAPLMGPLRVGITFEDIEKEDSAQNDPFSQQIPALFDDSTIVTSREFGVVYSPIGLIGINSHFPTLRALRRHQGRCHITPMDAVVAAELEDSNDTFDERNSPACSSEQPEERDTKPINEAEAGHKLPYSPPYLAINDVQIGGLHQHLGAGITNFIKMSTRNRLWFIDARTGNNGRRDSEMAALKLPKPLHSLGVIINNVSNTVMFTANGKLLDREFTLSEDAAGKPGAIEVGRFFFITVNQGGCRVQFGNHQEQNDGFEFDIMGYVRETMDSYGGGAESVAARNKAIMRNIRRHISLYGYSAVKLSSNMSGNELAAHRLRGKLRELYMRTRDINKCITLARNYKNDVFSQRTLYKMKLFNFAVRLGQSHTTIQALRIGQEMLNSNLTFCQQRDVVLLINAFGGRQAHVDAVAYYSGEPAKLELLGFIEQDLLVAQAPPEILLNIESVREMTAEASNEA